MIVRRPASIPRKANRRRERRDRVSTDVVLFFVDPEGQGATVRGQLLDVSSHGARFRTTREVCLQSPVKFRHAGLGVGGSGIVRYCNWSPAGFDVGVEFQQGTGWPTPDRTVQSDASEGTVAAGGTD
jgi:PilZ domain